MCKQISEKKFWQGTPIVLGIPLLTSRDSEAELKLEEMDVF